MMKNILEYSRKPRLYEQSTCEFWNDEHISKQMLEAHLNPNWEAASRKHDFIDQSVNWIEAIAPKEKYGKVLDLGCGPGLYAQRLFHRGYNVTGVDFSRRSIDYAMSKAVEAGADIEYIYKNYLEIEYRDQYDLVLLIYCDYGGLTAEQRKIMLGKIFASMKEGAKFIVDVFTPNYFKGTKEGNKEWNAYENGGFFSPEPHMSLNAHYLYENDVHVNQHIIIREDQSVDVYRIWFACYSAETIRAEFQEAGFKNIEIYSDVSGREYHKDSETVCVVAEK